MCRFGAAIAARSVVFLVWVGDDVCFAKRVVSVILNEWRTVAVADLNFGVGGTN